MCAFITMHSTEIRTQLYEPLRQYSTVTDHTRTTYTLQPIMHALLMVTRKIHDAQDPLTCAHTITQTLHVANATNCFQILYPSREGHHASWRALFAVSEFAVSFLPVWSSSSSSSLRSCMQNETRFYTCCQLKHSFGTISHIATEADATRRNMAERDVRTRRSREISRRTAIFAQICDSNARYEGERAACHCTVFLQSRNFKMSLYRDHAAVPTTRYGQQKMGGKSVIVCWVAVTSGVVYVRVYVL